MILEKWSFSHFKRFKNYLCSEYSVVDITEDFHRCLALSSPTPAKCGVLHLDHNPMQSYRLEDKWLDSCQEEKGPGYVSWQPSEPEPVCVPWWPRRPMTSWPVSEISWPTGPGQWLSLHTWPWLGFPLNLVFSVQGLQVRKNFEVL